MKVATLQLNARLGCVKDNISRATALVKDIEPASIDILVLPELAFSGYNFPSLTTIEPFLEPTGAGPSADWARLIARQLECIVIVGYPEVTSEGERYNSTVMVDSNGQTLGQGYRKSFLYYTDQTWATEGEGFSRGIGSIETTANPQRKQTVSITQGICMDINPYNFTAPWDACEFANHAVEARSDVVLLSMAWLSGAYVPDETAPDPFQEDKSPVWPDGDAETPNLETLSYWVARLRPLIDQDRFTIVVIGNRCGREGSARYAGTSCVLKVGWSQVLIYDMLDRGSEKMLSVDTALPPRLELKTRTENESQI